MRCYLGWRPLVGDLISIDLAWLRREPVLLTGVATRITWTCCDEVTGEALISIQGDCLEIEMAGRLHTLGWLWSDTRFGGRRRWFACPRCERGCRVVYFGEAMLACRRCLGLGYESEYESPADTALKRARKIVKSLGGTELALPMPFPPKPKYMHWSTYWTLKARCERWQQVWVDRCAADLRRIQGRRLELP